VGTDAVAGQAGGLQAWLTTNVANSSGGGFNSGTGIVDASTPATKTALTETDIRDVAELVYNEGGNPTCAVMRPTVCRKLSEYLFTSSARIATMTSEVGQADDAATAKGSVNIFVTDFGVTLDLIPNRLQQDETAGESTLFLVDPSHLRFSTLHGYRTEPLAKVGLSDKRLMAVDWTMVVTTERAHGMVAAIDNTLAVAA
jgi:hypothetical protein